jgi:uroporphyrin-III C-methyltransferase
MSLDPGQPGKVCIVGAGPGDPELLTIKAMRALERADVVLYDRLVASAILELIPASVQRIYVGKGHGDQDLVQPEIMQQLEDFARQGLNVVRLKGGDPFVFGRGAEEWAYLHTRGIQVEVVPGISSSLAVPALAGIPLTFRNVARAFAVLTGHRAIDPETGIAADWNDYVKVDTLVILMGVGERVSIASELIDAGREASHACAFIERGSTPQERVVISSLQAVADGLTDVNAPAVWVIGDVVRLRETLLG